MWDCEKKKERELQQQVKSLGFSFPLVKTCLVFARTIHLKIREVLQRPVETSLFVREAVVPSMTHGVTEAVCTKPNSSIALHTTCYVSLVDFVTVVCHGIIKSGLVLVSCVL